MIDVVMGEDDAVDCAQAVLLHEPKHRLEAAGVPGVDDREPLATVVQVGLGTANARNRPDHPRIIG